MCGDESVPALIGSGSSGTQPATIIIARRKALVSIPVTDVICQIVSGELDAAVVARDGEVIAFLDHRPVFKGHVLVAPTRHVENLLTLPSNLMVPLLTMAQRVAAAIGIALSAQGTFVAINNVVSQSIPHLHVHVVPRTKGDGCRRGFFWPRTHYAAGEIETYARADFRSHDRCRAASGARPGAPKYPTPVEIAEGPRPVTVTRAPAHG